LKAGIVERVETVIAGQRESSRISTATNQHVTVKELILIIINIIFYESSNKIRRRYGIKSVLNIACLFAKKKIWNYKAKCKHGHVCYDH
jgi:hypothetical protein